MDWRVAKRGEEIKARLHNRCEWCNLLIKNLYRYKGIMYDSNKYCCFHCVMEEYRFVRKKHRWRKRPILLESNNGIPFEHRYKIIKLYSTNQSPDE